MAKKISVFRIDYGTIARKYVGTQYIEAPSKAVVIAYARAGSIFNTSSRKLLKVTKINSVKTEQNKMSRNIIVRKLT